MIPLHLPPGDTSTERTLQIDGSSEQIESAKQLVNEVISEVRLQIWVTYLFCLVVVGINTWLTPTSIYFCVYNDFSCLSLVIFYTTVDATVPSYSETPLVLFSQKKLQFYKF